MQAALAGLEMQAAVATEVQNEQEQQMGDYSSSSKAWSTLSGSCYHATWVDWCTNSPWRSSSTRAGASTRISTDRLSTQQCRTTATIACVQVTLGIRCEQGGDVRREFIARGV